MNAEETGEIALSLKCHYTNKILKLVTDAMINLDKGEELDYEAFFNEVLAITCTSASLFDELTQNEKD